MRGNLAHQETDSIEVVRNDIVLHAGAMRDRLEGKMNRAGREHLVIANGQHDAALVFDRKIAPAANG